MIDANTLLDPQGRVVESARLLGLAIVEALREHDQVEVSLRHLKGAASSYFNTVLASIVAEFGIAGISRVQFHFASVAQQDTFERSLQALRLSRSA